MFDNFLLIFQVDDELISRLYIILSLNSRSNSGVFEEEISGNSQLRYVSVDGKCPLVIVAFVSSFVVKSLRKTMICIKN
jgi:hypothetical protein